MSKTFISTFTVKEVHLDTFGHMNNATYLTLFEDARWDLLSDNGYGIDVIRASGFGPIILEINIKYLRELLLRQNVSIETSCTSYDGKVGRMTQLMKVGDDECAHMELLFALFSLSERKIVEPTRQWLTAIGVS